MQITKFSAMAAAAMILATAGGAIASQQGIMSQQKDALSACSGPTAELLRMPHNTGDSYHLMLLEGEAKCLVEAAKAPAYGTPAMVEMAKWAAWENLIRSADVYMSRTKVLFSGKYTEREPNTILGIRLKTPISEIPGFANAAAGKPWTTYNYDGSRTNSSAFQRPSDFTRVISTYRVVSENGERTVEITKIDQLGDEAAIAAYDAKVKADRPGFFGGLKNLGMNVLGGMAAQNRNENDRAVTSYKQDEQESATFDFGGVKVNKIHYIFDQNQRFGGIYAKISDRDSMSLSYERQQIPAIFASLNNLLGPPTAMIKSPDIHGSAGDTRTWNEGVWIGKNGVRVDVHCEGNGLNATDCTNGSIQVRDLSGQPAKEKTDANNFFESK
jgi:hypothetical protein